MATNNTVNRIELIGYMGAMPDMRYTANGAPATGCASALLTRMTMRSLRGICGIPESWAATSLPPFAAWEPKNFDGTYDGPMRMRQALIKSKNLVSIRILQAITPKYAQDYLTKFGFDPAKHPPYLTMALGAGSAARSERIKGPWSAAAASGAAVAVVARNERRERRERGCINCLTFGPDGANCAKHRPA